MQINIAMPDGSDFRATALAANDSLAIADRARVTSASGAFGLVANAGMTQSDFGVSSNVGNVISVAPVSLRDRSHVFGSVRSGGSVTRSNGVAVDGVVTTNVPFGAPSVASWQIQFLQSSQNITLTQGQSLALSPGSYSRVTVYASANLGLRTGTYFIDQLDLESQARVVLDESAGPIVVYVQGSLIYRGNVTGGSADRLLLVYLGSQFTALETSFRGTFVAPSASVRLGVGGTPHSGAVFAKAVQVDPDVTFTAVPFASWDSVILGVSPTLNCVVQLNGTTLGAVFGYRNTTSASVRLGAGPRNFFSSATDLGQPILFVPGDVPIASVQLFSTGSQLAWTIGQQSVVASSSSNACPAALGNAVSALFTETADTKAVRQSAVAMLSNPRFAAWINAARTAAGSQLTPFQTSLFGSLDLVLANVDLLGDPAALTSAQRARLPDFRSQLLSNEAITALRMAGDAKRASAHELQCAALAALNRSLPIEPFRPVQAGSVYADTLAVTSSLAYANVQAAYTGVVTGDQSDVLLGAPGLMLAGLLPDTEIANLQLAGPIPVGISLGKIVGAVVGAVTGGYLGSYAGAAIGGALGGPPGAVAGYWIGAFIGGIAGAVLGSHPCQLCLDSSSCGISECTAGCCEDSVDIGVAIFFLSGGGCANSAPSCRVDADCGGGGAECIEGCCVPLALRTSLCPGEGCTSDADCASGNTCQAGCCANRCGVNGTICSLVASDTCDINATDCGRFSICDIHGCCQADPH